MDWNGNLRTPAPPFVPRPPPDYNSFSFFYNYNFDPYSVLEMKHPPQMQMQMTQQNGVIQVPEVANVDKKSSNSNSNSSYNNGGIMVKNHYHHHQVVALEKKKRLTNEQLESLESCFQEEIKLDPDRKMKLARELGLQPRQIAVWFQNRRARWKNKQLEHLYDSLKQQFHLVSTEKLRLQQEVLTLRNILKEQVEKNPISTTTTGNYTDQMTSTGEAETVESTSIPTSTKSQPPPPPQQQHLHLGECSYVFNNLAVVDNIDNNNVINIPPSPYTWTTTTTALPIYP